MSWNRAERLHCGTSRRLLSPLLTVADFLRIQLNAAKHTYHGKKIMSITPRRWCAITLVAGVGIGVSATASAHVDVGVDIGVPGIAVAPQPVYVAPPPVYEAPPPAPAVIVSPGWYGERYYDGHRYWERREWEERHHDERDWRDARAHYDEHRGDWGRYHDEGGPRGDWHHDHGDGDGRHDH